MRSRPGKQNERAYQQCHPGSTLYAPDVTHRRMPAGLLKAQRLIRKTKVQNILGWFKVQNMLGWFVLGVLTSQILFGCACITSIYMY